MREANNFLKLWQLRHLWQSWQFPGRMLLCSIKMPLVSMSHFLPVLEKEAILDTIEGPNGWNPG